MKPRNTCPGCRITVPSDAPRGLCPRCLASSAVEFEVMGGNPDEAVARLPMSGQFGDYEILGEIARGGMGIVYRARQISLKRPVAIKTMLSGQLASKTEARRFCSEIESARSLHHPNIVEVYDAGEHEGQLYYSMRLVEGQSLALRIAQGKSFSNTGRVRLMIKVARAIHHAHQHGILHRDLKPGNILLDGNDEPLVTDFGLARQVAGPGDLTLSGMVVGSPSYMSPEQASGQSRHLTTATDIYSLGAIFYALLTGQPPFSGETHLDTVRKLLDREPPTPRTLNPGIDRDLETVCLKCLEKVPQDRYGSAEAVAEDLERWMRREPILARPATPAEKLAKWARRKPAVALLAGIAFLAVAGGVAGVFWAWRTTEAARRIAVAERQRARTAEQDATDKLRDAYLAQAHANRLTSEPGRRFRSLEILAKAAAIRPGGDLRDEAIATLACSDLRATQTNYPQAVTATSPDDRFALFALNTAEGGISLRNLEDGRELKRIPAAESGLDFLFPLSHSGRWVAARYKDSSVRIWDADQGALVLTQQVAVLAQAVDFRPDDERVAIADGSREVRIHETSSGRRLSTIHPRQPPEQVAYSPDGRRLAVAGSQGMLALYDADTAEFVRDLAQTSPLTGMAWHPDGRRLAATSHDRHVVIWDADTGARLHRLIGHGEEVHHVAFHPGGELLLSAGWDGVMLWNTRTGQRLMVLPIPCSFLKLSPDGARFFGRNFNRAHFILGELAHGSPARSYGSKEPSDVARTAAFSPGGSLLAYLDNDHLHWFETRTGGELARVRRQNTENFTFDSATNFWSWGSDAAWRQTLRPGPSAGEWQLGPRESMPPSAEGTLIGTSPLGRHFATVKDRSLTLLDTESLRTLAVLKPAAAGLRAGINPEASRLCLGSWHSDKMWFLEPAGTGAVMSLRFTLTNQAAFCGAPAFSATGRRLAIHWGTSLALLDPSTRRPLWSLPLDDLPILAFAPNEELLAVRTGKRLVRLVAAETGTVLATFENPSGMPVKQLLFSGDNASLAVVSDGLSEMYVWDLARLRLELARIGLDWSPSPTGKDPEPAVVTRLLLDPQDSPAAGRPVP